jgi:hypothetical protein
LVEFLTLCCHLYKKNWSSFINAEWEKYKKFWEELIAYFVLIRHGPHRNRSVQQFYCCLCNSWLVTFLPSRCLATKGVTHTYR